LGKHGDAQIGCDQSQDGLSILVAINLGANFRERAAELVEYPEQEHDENAQHADRDQ